MAEKNYGSVIIVDADNKVIGVATDRDVMNKVVGKELDPKTTPPIRYHDKRSASGAGNR